MREPVWMSGGRVSEGVRPEGRRAPVEDVRWAWRKGMGASLAKVWAGKERVWVEGEGEEAEVEAARGVGPDAGLIAIVKKVYEFDMKTSRVRRR